MSATELAGAIRSRQVSSREVIEAHLRRIEAVNHSINAVTAVLADEAIAAAEAADHAAPAGGELPRFHGVPFTVKSNIDVAGTPTTHGMRAFADAYPTREAAVVERLEAAGGIPIGRTNMPDFAISWHTDSELYGATFEPVGPETDPRRLQRWRGSCDRHRHEPYGPRERHARIVALASAELRHRHIEARPCVRILLTSPSLTMSMPPQPACVHCGSRDTRAGLRTGVGHTETTRRAATPEL